MNDKPDLVERKMALQKQLEDYSQTAMLREQARIRDQFAAYPRHRSIQEWVRRKSEMQEARKTIVEQIRELDIEFAKVKGEARQARATERQFASAERRLSEILEDILTELRKLTQP